MKKIFVLTGEPSGDKLASNVIKSLNEKKKDIEYLGVCGNNLKSLGIKSIFDQKDITYMAFTDVIFNFLKIKKKIDLTVNEVIKFNPSILLTVDSPDFSLRVSEKVKQINPKIKTIHFIAPKVWAWREGRVKKMKKFLDHILLLFGFEKKFFDKENLKNTFVGHPLLDSMEKDINVEINDFVEKKNIVSLFPGSRDSEIKILFPVLINFIKKMNLKDNSYHYIFHSTQKFKEMIKSKLLAEKLSNVEVVSDDKIKSQVLKKSIFAIVKSGTVSLDVCKNNIPSIGRKSVKSQLLDETKFIVNDQSESTNVIGIIEGKIITDHLNESIPIIKGDKKPDASRDLIRVTVIERHGKNNNIANGFVHGFGRSHRWRHRRETRGGILCPGGCELILWQGWHRRRC